MANIEDHVHLLRVFRLLHTFGGELNDPRSNERRAEQLGEPECRIFDFSGFNAGRSVCNV